MFKLSELWPAVIWLAPVSLEIFTLWNSLMSQARLCLPCPTARMGHFSKVFIGSGVRRGSGGAGTKRVPCRQGRVLSGHFLWTELGNIDFKIHELMFVFSVQFERYILFYILYFFCQHRNNTISEWRYYLFYFIIQCKENTFKMGLIVTVKLPNMVNPLKCILDVWQIIGTANDLL